MTGVDLDKTKLRQSFAAASVSYDQAAALQRQVGDALLARHQELSFGGRVLDLGCGTGYLTEQLIMQRDYDSVMALDIAWPMLQATRQRLSLESLICADAEYWPIQEQALDRVFSNLALQWCRALATVMADVYTSLTDQGQFVFSTFGPKTLQELRWAWEAVDRCSHVNDFYPLEQIVGWLNDAGFRRIETTTVVYRSPYSSVMALMQELKAIGAHNVTALRRRQVTTPRQLKRMMRAYPCEHEGIIATYEVFFVIADK